MTDHIATGDHTGHHHDITDAANRVCEHGHAVYLDHTGSIPFAYRGIIGYAIQHHADVTTRTVSGAWSATIGQLGVAGNVFLWYRGGVYTVTVTTGSHRGLPVTAMLDLNTDMERIMAVVNAFCRR